MRLISSIRQTDLTPEGVFANKYAWLMRWAMHFSRNDRSLAEDLVQDVFVRMLLAWDTLHSLDDLEPLLYSYLRYAHLTGLRRGSSYVFQSLSTVDSDTLAISLRTSNSFDQIEVQNELRSILHYLLWRKDLAKFASIFLLRFFHGFYPEEIAVICVATRHSIDLSLRHARGEVKSYLLDPRSMEVAGRRRSPDLQQPNFALPAQEFVHELRGEMFGSVRDLCPSQAEIERNYHPACERSIDCGFLAHIVVCELCLEKVTRICGAPPPSARSMEDSLGAASRSKQSKKSLSGEKAIVARAISESKRRLREILEHHPTGLMIALNGEVLAVRDVSSRRAVLKVEAHTMEKLELIEFLSEQGSLLLTLPILANPPMQSPQLRHQVRLSSDRTVALRVDFTCSGASVEATYEDPHFTEETSEYQEALNQEEASLTRFPSHKGGLSEIRHTAIEEYPGFDPKNHRDRVGARAPLQDRINRFCAWLFGSKALVYIGISGVAAIGAAVWLQDHRTDERDRFATSLLKLVQSERHASSSLGHVAVHRRLEIYARGKIVERDLYSDPENHRRPRQHALNQDEQILRAKFDEATLDWKDPLTAEGFQRWHDHLRGRVTDVEENRGNLIVMTSTVEANPSRKGNDDAVRFESLTVRSSDFHPVARKVLFEDGETINIAEVAFETVPWDNVNPDWFEPSGLSSLHRSTPALATHATPSPMQLPDGEIDVAALGVLQALEEMHADTERLEVNTTHRGVEVTGVVESAVRKQQLQARLGAIPHVKPEIFTYQEMDLKNADKPGTQSLRAVSVASADSQLDAQCKAIQIPHDDCQRWSYSLLDASTVLSRDSKRLIELELQYPASKPLSREAKTILASLITEHLGHLDAALWDQQQALQTLQLWPAAQSEGEAADGSLANATARNQASIHELVYASNESARPAAAIVRDLAHSLKEARHAISNMPSYAADKTAMSSGILTPQE